MTYDLVVIGGGSAGLTAAIFGAHLGARVLLAERARLGGDCLWTGCVPSKALLSAAAAAAAARSARAMGIDVDLRVDFLRVRDHVSEAQAMIAEHDSVQALAGHGVEVVFGAARLGAPGVVHLPDRVVRCRRVILATGASPVHPELPGLADVAPLDHTTIWSMAELPRRLLVLGGGPIGCELGQALSRLGSAVTLLEREGRILPGFHERAARCVEQSLARDGVDIWTGASASGFSKVGLTARLHARLGDGSEVERDFDAVLLATGRAASVEGLGLREAGVILDRHGVRVDDTLRTSRPDVYAAGDCAGAPQSTHWAEHEARVATRNALYRGSERVDRSLAPRVLFTDPEIAQLGALAGEVYEVPLARIDRAIVSRRTEGFCQVHVDEDGRVAGALLCGADAAELAAELSLAMVKRLRLSELGDAIHPYPTRSRVLRRLADEVFLSSGPPDWTRWFARFRSQRPSRRLPTGLRRVLVTALLTSIFVGTLLNLVNQGSAISATLAGSPQPIRWSSLVLNFLVPFLVSGVSGLVATRRPHAKEERAAPRSDAHASRSSE